MAPEQERALAYLRRKGTDADPESLRQRIAAAFADFESTLEGLGGEDVRRRPAGGGWCVQEVVDHLVESHRRAAAQLAAIVAGRPACEAVPAGLLSADPLARDWDDLASELKRVHAEVLDAFAKGTAEIGAAPRAPVVMVVKVREGDGPPQPREWIEELDWKAFALGIGVHTREHADQVRRILGA
ncbi:MAG TPA: DinB family protein [Thermoanaerobaculia bacterium]|jgi:hypothetical protein